MRLTAAVAQDGGWHVARCLEVEVASQGKSVEEALGNLRQALALYFEDRDDQSEPYDLTDPVEIVLIDQALQDPRPSLSGEEARAYVRAQLKKHGIG